jgi:hypothetical protein
MAYHFKVMPFGLRNSAQTLAFVMERVLGTDLEPECFVYLDDIIVATDSFERHLEVLTEVAKRLKKANLSVNLEKSKFIKKSIKFLGCVR